MGTGHADLNRFEWAVNIHRDRCAGELLVHWSAGAGPHAHTFSYLRTSSQGPYAAGVPRAPSYASYIGHHNLLSYFAVAENESIGRMKHKFMEKVRCSAAGRPCCEQPGLVTLLAGACVHTTERRLSARRCLRLAECRRRGKTMRNRTDLSVVGSPVPPTAK